MGRLDGKVAIVTGSGGGIGRGIARQFALEGASVVVADIDPEKVATVERELKELSSEVLCNVCDVSDPEHVRALVAAAVERFGTVDVLVNDAYYGPAPQPLEELSLAEWERCQRVGPTATFLLSQQCFPHLKGGGRIINFGSELSDHPQLGRTAYSASKGAIRGFTKSLAWEWGKYDITVNTVWPSARTPSWDRWAAIDPEGVERVLNDEMAIKRTGDPEMDVARVVVFLASDDSRWVTGQTIGANGGRTMV